MVAQIFAHIFSFEKFFVDNRCDTTDHKCKNKIFYTYGPSVKKRRVPVVTQIKKLRNRPHGTDAQRHDEHFFAQILSHHKQCDPNEQ